jgi:ABC-type multidrug transport system fused ATPase/permease subunit
MTDISANFDINAIIDFISAPSFQTIQLALVIYIGLLWLAVIIWVTRDAIHRSDSLIFQVISILINIIFPLLGILLYLIIRPGKTTAERYYEELEHRLILESIGETEPESGEDIKMHKKAIKKTVKKAEKDE